MELLRITFGERYPVPPTVAAEWSGQSGSIVGLLAQAQLRGLSQEFIVYGRIRQKEFDLGRLERKTRTAVVEGFAGKAITNLFRVVDVVVEAGTAEMPGEEAHLSLNEETASRFEEQALRGNAAALSLRKNLQEMRRLVESLAFLDATTRSKFQHYLGQLQKYRETMALGAKAGWCAEKYARLQVALAELGRLRDPTDAQYREQLADIREWLQEWPVVNRWHTEPPTG